MESSVEATGCKTSTLLNNHSVSAAAFASAEPWIHVKLACPTGLRICVIMATFSPLTDPTFLQAVHRINQ